MTPELWILVGFTLFQALLFYFSVSRIREAHRTAMDSLQADKKALHALLKDAQNRIHAASLQDYLALSGRDNGEFQSMRRSDAIEAEIAQRST